MAYVVKKPLDIGGRRRVIGEILRDDEVMGGSVIRSGYVAKIESDLVNIAAAADSLAKGAYGAGKVNLPVLSENGSTVISVAPESISEAVRIMQLSQADAIAAVKESADKDILTVISLCESNKTILSTVRKRLAELEDADGGSAGEA